MKRIFIVNIICSLYILLFIYAASSKLMDYQQFKTQLGSSPLLTKYAGAVSIAIPALEIGLSLMLVSKRWKLLSLYLSLGLMVAFASYIIVVTHYSYYVPCSCGGVLQHMTWNQHLIFNFLFIGLAITAILLHTNGPRPATGEAENLYI